MGLIQRLVGFDQKERKPAKPMTEMGVGGFIIQRGYLDQNETNPKLLGQTRWRTAQDLLSNISIIAASVRYMLDLTARPTWSVSPADDSNEAAAAAEFMQEIIDDTATSWTRIIRRSAIYRFHGFNLCEWTAKRREDGKLGIKDIEQRPAHTVERWDTDEQGNVEGVMQRAPQSGHEVYLPRRKLVYLVDDALTDRPDGMGWFRHLVEPASRLRRLLDLETIGFDRDLRGIPVGRVPLGRINEKIANGKLTKEQGEAMVASITDFVKMEAKATTTGLVFDSEPIRAKTDGGESISTHKEWDMEVLTADASGLPEIAKAVRRIEFEMALVMGTQQMLVGREGEGSRALSEDVSRNLYLTVNSTLEDMTEAYDRDIIDPVWEMNGLPPELKPSFQVEDASFRDVTEVVSALRELSTAGAVLTPDDPAINDLRRMLNLPEAPEPDQTLLTAGEGGTAAQGAGTGGTQRPANDDDGNDDDGGGGGGDPDEGRRATKYNPDQPRYPAGHPQGGQWAGDAAGDTGDEKQSEVKTKARDVSGKPPIGEKFIVFRAASEQDTTLKGSNAGTLGGVSYFLGETGDPYSSMGSHSYGHHSHIHVYEVEVEGEFGEYGGRGRGISWGNQKGGEVGLQQGGGGNWYSFGERGFSAKHLAAISLEEYGDELEKHPYESFGGNVARSRHPDMHPLPSKYKAMDAVLRRKGVIEDSIAPEGLEKRFDPNQPRVPAGQAGGGRWTDGDDGGGEKNPVHPPETNKKKDWADELDGQSLDDLLEMATENDKEIDAFGAELAAQTGLGWEKGPLKTRTRVLEKVANEGYDGPHQITDYSRGSILVTEAGQAQRAIDMLSERFEVYDKGWKAIPDSNYLDRKVYIRHDNGGVSEIQITPAGVFQIKMGEGHRLYEVIRSPKSSAQQVKQAQERSLQLYTQTLRGTPFMKYVEVG